MSKLRFQDPSDLSELDLMRAARHVFTERLTLGPERLGSIIRSAYDRLGMDMGELAKFTGCPLTTLYGYLRVTPN